ncbi:MAG TPA: acetate kinase [Acidobacteriaceae bacterium]|nr:acetate kinase [Acidobacteriaceae bacterium]
MKILVLNSGSSSQKTSLYEIGGAIPETPPQPLWEGKIEWDDHGGEVKISTAAGAVRKERWEPPSRMQGIKDLLRTLWEGSTRVVEGPSEIAIAGHRVVHGGPDYREPALLTPEVRAAIAAVAPFAPLQNRVELQGMEMVEQSLGPVRQCAVFDTGFHRTMPLSAVTYPGPYEWYAEGIRRYGFHGINHQYCSMRAAKLLGREVNSFKLVSCHLGGGCSLAAVLNGESVDTTMGFTPLEGLMMGTRSGSIDPEILIYLMRQRQISADQLDEMLNRRSGLLGISGVSDDMRQVLAAKQAGNQRAALAFEIYVHRLRSAIGAMIAVLDGADALVFTAGVGENSPDVRSAACEGFRHMGLRLDEVRNKEPLADRDIAAADSAVRVLVIRAQEDWQIAQACWKLGREPQRAPVAH